MKQSLFILSARRTPVGTFLGSLKNFSAVELGVMAAKAALQDSKISGDEISHSIFGNVCSASSPDGPYLARHIGLKSGVRQSAGGLTVNRLCGSGFEALLQASAWVNEGPVLVGGAENMSLMPLFLRGVREGFKFAQPPQSVDSLWEALTDQHIKMSMGETAELLAKDFSITREDCDRWALMSHQRAAACADRGGFKSEIVSVLLPGDKIFNIDEHIRRDSTIEKLAKLKPVFKGVTTAANASGMNDAAGALVVASEAYAKDWSKRTGLKPLAKVVASSAVGCDPSRMGIGPVEAIKKVLAEINWSMKDVNYLEINEAFAAQILSVKKALNLSDEQLNPHGSGISLGHPLGATGARISCHIAHEISSGNITRAIGSACIGGGQGIAVAFERVVS
jgi:acetyl-CoA acetyltransferase family protein